jgi:hypothetical protein
MDEYILEYGGVICMIILGSVALGFLAKVMGIVVAL